MSDDINEQGFINQQAEEILDYCVCLLSNKDNLEQEEFKKKRLYKRMIKQIAILMEGEY